MNLLDWFELHLRTCQRMIINCQSRQKTGGQYSRWFCAPTINEAAVIIVGEKFDSHMLHSNIRFHFNKDKYGHQLDLTLRV